MRKAFVLVCLMVSMGVFGCNKAQKVQALDPVELVAEAEAEVAKAETCAIASEAVVAEVSAWVDANNALGLSLLRAAPLQVGAGAIVSPYSVQRAMGMVLEGACGETASQMRTALSLPDAGNLSRLGSEVEAALLGEFAPFVTVNIDNRLWVEKTFTLAEDYLARVRDYYRALPEAVDFRMAFEASRKIINDAVAQATNGKIQDILPSGSINSLTRLVLTNAVYFKAPWANAFDANLTKKGDFAAPHGAVQVDMMHLSKQLPLYVHEQFMALVMPYAGSPYGMLVILPNRVDGKSEVEALGAVEASLTPELLRTMITEARPAQVNLTLPKFRIEASLSLKEHLTGLGMKLAFDQEANFSRMAAGADLMVSDVLHKAFIDVNEEGTEAAAATAVPMMTRGMLLPQGDPVDFIADRPFTFALVQGEKAVMLFVGRVVKP
ncbi:MAG: serpin family protein [Proteobacteria bacterium]|nr:serpin family protein [Pseudomonadota bacterium]